VCESNLDGAALVCEGCAGKVERLGSPGCIRCGAPSGVIRNSCVCRNLTAGIESLRSSTFYEGVVRDVIHHFKFGGYWGLASRMADMMEEDGRRLVEAMDDTVVVGIPLHRVRLKERGYDQAKLLARSLSGRLGLEYVEGVVKRIKNSKPQARLSLRERKGNVQDAFTIDDPSKIDNKTVLLIDDVCTTGITLSSCANVLTDAGARGVFALTFARRMLVEPFEGG